MQNKSKTTAAALLGWAVIAASLGAEAQIQCRANTTAEPQPNYVQNYFVRGMEIFQQENPDQWYRCGLALGGLQAAKIAAIHASDYSVAQAADILYRAFAEAAASFPEDWDSNIPHAAMAIRSSARILQNVNQTLAHDGRARIHLPAQAQLMYGLGMELVSFVEQAYYNLDVYAYGRRPHSGLTICSGYDCRSGYHGGFPGAGFPTIAFDENVKVVRSLLNLQSRLGRLLYKDAIEVSFIASVAGAGKDMLLNSSLARQNSCAIVRLQEVQLMAENAICGATPAPQQNWLGRPGQPVPSNASPHMTSTLFRLRQALDSIQLSDGRGCRPEQFHYRRW